MINKDKKKGKEGLRRIEDTDVLIVMVILYLIH